MYIKYQVLVEIKKLIQLRIKYQKPTSARTFFERSTKLKYLFYFMYILRFTLKQQFKNGKNI